MDSRLKVWGQILRLPWLVGAAFFVLLGIFDLLAGQFFPDPSKVPRIIEVLPGWSFAAWSAFALLALLAATLEGAYRAIGKREKGLRELVAKVKREREELGQTIGRMTKFQNETVHKRSHAQGMLSRHVTKGEVLIDGEALTLSDTSAHAWVDEAERLIRSLLKEKCVGQFLEIAKFDRPKTGHPGMLKVYVGKHVPALKSVADNLTVDDLKDDANENG